MTQRRGLHGIDGRTERRALARGLGLQKDPATPPAAKKARKKRVKKRRR